MIRTDHFRLPSDAGQGVQTTGETSAMNYLALTDLLDRTSGLQAKRHLFESYDGGKRDPMSLEDAVALAMDLNDDSYHYSWAILRDLKGGHYLAPSIGSWGVPPKELAGRISVYGVNGHGAGWPVNIMGQEWRRARELGFDIDKGYQCQSLPRLIWVSAPAEMAAEDIWTSGHHTSRRQVVCGMSEGDVLACRRINDGGAIGHKPTEVAGVKGFRIRGRVVSAERMAGGELVAVAEGEWPWPGAPEPMDADHQPGLRL
jgi:hypothetical protein